MLLSPGLCFAGACDFPLLSAVEEEEVGIRKSFARRLYLWNYSQGQTIIMKFYFYKVQFFFFFNHGNVCFLTFGGNIQKYSGVGRLIFPHYFALMNSFRMRHLGYF